MLAKLQHDLNAEHRLGLSGELFDRSSDSERLFDQGAGTSYAQGNNNGFEKDSRKRAVLSYGFHAQAAKAAIQNGEIKLYWQRSRHEGGLDAVRVPDARGAMPPGSTLGYQYPYGPYGRSNSVEETDYGLVSQWDGYLIGGSVQHHWPAGLELNRNRNTQYSSGYDNCPATLPSWGFFPPDFMGPRNCGFLHTNQAQLYLNYGAPGTYLRVGNQDLKPEVSHGYELGIEAGDAARGARLSFYDNRYRDYIDNVAITSASPDWNPAWAGVYPMGVTRTINRSRVRIYGVELEGHWDFDMHWYTRGSLAWTHGRDLDEDQYLNSVAPLKAILALGYRTPQWGAEAISTLARRRTQIADPQADFQAPGYGVMDLNAWWTPAAIKGLRVQAGVLNVFDKKYWNALDVPDGKPSRAIDWYTQPGRSLRVSVSYQY